MLMKIGNVPKLYSLIDADTIDIGLKKSRVG